MKTRKHDSLPAAEINNRLSALGYMISDDINVLMNSTMIVRWSLTFSINPEKTAQQKLISPLQRLVRTKVFAFQVWSGRTRRIKLGKMNHDSILSLFFFSLIYFRSAPRQLCRTRFSSKASPDASLVTAPHTGVFRNQTWEFQDSLSFSFSFFVSMGVRRNPIVPYLRFPLQFY